MKARNQQAFLLLVVSLAFSGCVSARMSDRKIDDAFRARDFSRASAYLQKGLEKQGEEGKDALLYLMDLGITQHTAGDFAASIKTLLQADRMAEIKDYTSLSREASTLLVSDSTKPYKGEDFEKVLINTYLAMNFAFLNETESALVEARKVNRKLYLMVNEGKRKYQQSAFARYLAALLFESSGQLNDAYVDYKLSRDLLPNWRPLALDLYRLAFQLRMPDEMDRWEKEFSLTPSEKEAALRPLKVTPREGELIVIYQNGISPVKIPNPDFHSVPMYRARFNPVRYADVKVDGEIRGRTTVLHDIEETAIQNLRDNTAGIVAKKVGGLVAKQAAGAGVAKLTKNQALGDLASLVLQLADQADTRSWSLLPRDLQILRVFLPEGDHRVEVLPGGMPGRALVHEVRVQPGKRSFVNVRYIP